MKKTNGILAIFLAFMMIFISACQKTPTSTETYNSDQKKVSVYFSNKEGTNLVKKELDISKTEKKDVLKFIMENIIMPPNDENIKSAIRNGTKCLDIEEKERKVTVNLSKEFYNDENVADILAIASIVKSLCSVNNVDRVDIYIEGEPIKDANGIEIGIMQDSDFVFDAEALDSDEENIVLYFSDMQAEMLVPEIRRINVPKGEVMEKLVVYELLKGPETSDKYSIIPVGTKIISVETKDGVCFVNLSKEFVDKHSGGTTEENLTIFSIVNSLTELDGVSRVQFLIDGQKREVFKHIVFNEPFERDITIIRK